MAHEGETVTDLMQHEAADGDAEQSAEATDAGSVLLEKEGDVAADYLEGLLDVLDLDGDIDMDVENDRAAVSIVASDDSLNVLVGDGRVLDSLQELTRLAVGQVIGQRSRLMLDVAGHREGVRARVAERAREAMSTVRETGEPVALEPMTPFERKAVHDVVSAEGLTTMSEGESDDRHVVIHPAVAASADATS